MPCECSGYPEPTLGERVEKLNQAHEDLLECHRRKVTECDRLTEENRRLKERLADRVLADG